MHLSRVTLMASVNAALVAAADDIFTLSSNDSLLWGPYKPNLYFGMRPQLSKSISTGLLWGRVEDYREVQNKVRYTCEQSEDLLGYGWDKYDPRIGGVQTVKDQGNGIDLETSFVKFDEGKGGWGARIKGTVRDDAQPGVGSEGDVKDDLKTAVWFTVALEGLGTLDVVGAEAAEEIGFDRNVVINGQSTDLGEFSITINDPPEGNQHPVHRHPSFVSKPIDHTLVHSVQVPDEALWQSKRKSRTNDHLSFPC
jgi:mannosyl-oligosaccharide glucosidase